MQMRAVPYAYRTFALFESMTLRAVIANKMRAIINIMV